MGKKRPVIVTTTLHGVFFGYTDIEKGEELRLYDARMVLVWGTTRGFMELAEVGPNQNSKISAKADIWINHIDCIAEVTPEAEKKWQSI